MVAAGGSSGIHDLKYLFLSNIDVFWVLICIGYTD
jgi:hypothetical protein